VVQVEVGPNDREIEILNLATGERSTHPVAPGKTTSVQLPAAPAGTMFHVRVGTGRNAKLVPFEITGTGP
jgi:hypothetical protein